MSELEPPFDNIEDYVKYILHHQKRIYIREQIDGKWGSYSLFELPEDKKICHIMRFFEENISPVMLKEEVEET